MSDVTSERDKTELVRMRVPILSRLNWIKVPTSDWMLSEVLTGPGMLVTMVDSVSVLLLYKLLLTKNSTICLQLRAGNHEWTHHHQRQPPYFGVRGVKNV